jgi:hypothetical protein
LQDAGLGIHALHLTLVHHLENRTIRAVVKEGKIDVHSTFLRNHDLLRSRWADYLAERRVDVRHKKGFKCSPSSDQ